MIAQGIILRMRNVSDESCKENQSTHTLYSEAFSEGRAVYENAYEVWYSHTGHKRQCNTAHAHCMPDNKAKNTHTHVISSIHFFILD